MQGFIKKYQKALLAVFSVLLMVVFLINVPMSSLTGSGNHGQRVGAIGKTIIYSDEVRGGEQEWKILKSLQTYDFSQRQPEIVPIIRRRLGPALFDEIDAHPILFLLLRHEAEKRGIGVSQDLVGTVVANELRPPRDVSPEMEPFFRQAVGHLLLVEALNSRLTADAKLTEPMWEHLLAEGAQQIRLNLVEYEAIATLSPTTAPTTAPTTQQIEALYDEYKNTPPGGRAANDPLGFGYEVPNRVKLQYLEVSRQQVLDAVKASRDAYDLNVQAKMYYLQHAPEFTRLAPAQTQPATGPATQPAADATQPAAAPATQASAATQPSTRQVASTQAATTQASGPTTRPFDEVKQEIVDKLLKPDEDKLQKDITDALHTRLANGWEAFHKANPNGTTRPADTLPTTNVALGPQLPTSRPVMYDTYTYLEQVAQDIQSKYKVLPRVVQIAQWEDDRALSAEPGIGQAQAGSHYFPQYATQEAAPFVTDAAAAKTALQLWQPSEPLNSYQGNSYIFRLTDASPAHAPSLAEVRARVESDAQLKAGYETAAQQARAFAESAKAIGFSKAAVAAHRPVISTGAFRPSDSNNPYLPPEIPNFMTGPLTARLMIRKAHDLLNDATPDHPHPIAVIELPADRKVVVAELADVTSEIPPADLYREKLQTVNVYAMAKGSELAKTYFAYNAVIARLNYKPDKADAGE